MNTTSKIVLALVAGFALGGAAVQGLHAQVKPKAFILTESEVLDAAALAEYGPKAQAVISASGGKPAIPAAGSKVVAVVGAPPKRFGVNEWESLEKAQAYLNSAERKSLDALRAKALKINRQFIIEAPAN
jgi:uncharacterized protein (DUF1330 family)